MIPIIMIIINIIKNKTSKNFGKLPSPFNLSLRKKQHKQFRKIKILSRKFILEDDKIETFIVLEATPQH